MSMLLMVKAMNCKIGNSARKLVLIKLADNANDEGVCFPSYQHIADQCEMSRRSAISHIDALIEMGLVEKKIRKTQEGNTSNLYILHLEQGSENSALPPSENGAKVVKNLHYPSENISPTPSENFSPRTSHSINQSINHEKNINKKNSAFALLEQFGITDQLAEDFITHRKTRRASITETGLKRLQTQADLAKLPLQEVVAIMIERNWTGFKASWDWQGNGNAKTAVTPQKPQFDDTDTSWADGMVVEVGGELWQL